MNYMYDTWLVAEKAFIITIILNFIPLILAKLFGGSKISWKFIFGESALMAVFFSIMACILFKLGVIDWKFDLIIFKR